MRISRVLPCNINVDAVPLAVLYHCQNSGEIVAAADLMPFGRLLGDRLEAYNPFSIETQPLYGKSVAEMLDNDLLLVETRRQ